MITFTKLLRASFEAQQKEDNNQMVNPKLRVQLINVFGPEFLDEFELVPKSTAKIKGTDYHLCLGRDNLLFLSHNDTKTYPNKFSTFPIMKLSDLHRTLSRLENNY